MERWFAKIADLFSVGKGMEYANSFSQGGPLV